MEKQLPVDLDPKHLTPSVFGYKKEEVLELLDRSNERIQGLIKENFYLRSELDKIHEELLEAQQVKSQVEGQKQHVDEYAENVYKTANAQVASVRDDIKKLQAKKQSLVSDMRKVMEEHLAGLAEMAGGWGESEEVPHHEAS